MRGTDEETQRAGPFRVGGTGHEARGKVRSRAGGRAGEATTHLVRKQATAVEADAAEDGERLVQHADLKDRLDQRDVPKVARAVLVRALAGLAPQLVRRRAHAQVVHAVSRERQPSDDASAPLLSQRLRVQPGRRAAAARTQAACRAGQSRTPPPRSPRTPTFAAARGRGNEHGQAAVSTCMAGRGCVGCGGRGRVGYGGGGRVGYGGEAALDMAGEASSSTASHAGPSPRGPQLALVLVPDPLRVLVRLSISSCLSACPSPRAGSLRPRLVAPPLSLPLPPLNGRTISSGARRPNWIRLTRRSGAVDGSNAFCILAAQNARRGDAHAAAQ